ncbi:hypothetical protein DVH05_007140 [Phytophthora capsici]|nr:hypothetical protein DVH05_007140 [Phytophthora capsici]
MANLITALQTENAFLRELLVQANGHIRRLITQHHAEKMTLLNGLEARLNTLMEMHTSLMESLATTTTNRVTKAPPGEKVHGFALTISPLDNHGTHELRFIAGQQDYVTRKTTNVPANSILFGFTETGNPIDLRQNFMREANARLEARVGVYLREHPVYKSICFFISIHQV